MRFVLVLLCALLFKSTNSFGAIAPAGEHEQCRMTYTIKIINNNQEQVACERRIAQNCYSYDHADGFIFQSNSGEAPYFVDCIPKKSYLKKALCGLFQYFKLCFKETKFVNPIKFIFTSQDQSDDHQDFSNNYQIQINHLCGTAMMYIIPGQYYSYQVIDYDKTSETSFRTTSVEDPLTGSVDLKITCVTTRKLSLLDKTFFLAIGVIIFKKQLKQYGNKLYTFLCK